jgi:hypothetical protein
VKRTGIQQRQSTYFLLSEADGSNQNIFKQNLSAKTATALTTFKK